MTLIQGSRARLQVAGALAIVSLLPLFGCSLPDTTLSGKRCPCATDWVCDVRSNVCVPAGALGWPDREGPSDSVTSDGGRPAEEHVHDAALRDSDVENPTEEHDAGTTVVVSPDAAVVSSDAAVVSSDAGVTIVPDADTPPVDPCQAIPFPDADADGVCDLVDLCKGDNALGDADGDGVCGPPRPVEPKWFAATKYPEALGALGATALDGRLYIVGGDSAYSGSSPSTAHRTYDVGTGLYAPRAPAPDNNQWGPCVLAHGKYIYSFGGWSNGGNLMRRYDPAADSWTYLARNPRAQVWGFACGLIDGIVYIVGGSSQGSDAATNIVSAYDIAQDAWSAKAAFPAATLGLSGAAIDSKLYVLGRGSNLDIYDAKTNAWSAGPSIGRPGADAATVAYRGSLYVFGGSGSSGYSASVDRLTLPGLTWNSLPPLSFPRCNAAAAVVGDQIHVIGGFIPGASSSTPVSTHEVLVVP